MSLTQLNLNAVLSWALSASNTGFGATTQGPDSANFSLSGIDTTTFNEIATLQYTIAASGTQNVDLTSLTNLVSQSFSFGHALTLLILPTGSSVQLQPGASNGLAWFMNSTAVITIPNGGMFLYSEPVAGPGKVVDGTHKVLLFTNNGGTSLSLKLVIVGSTT